MSRGTALPASNGAPWRGPLTEPLLDYPVQSVTCAATASPRAAAGASPAEIDGDTRLRWREHADSASAARRDTSDATVFDGRAGLCRETRHAAG